MDYNVHDINGGSRHMICLPSKVMLRIFIHPYHTRSLPGS